MPLSSSSPVARQVMLWTLPTLPPVISIQWPMLNGRSSVMAMPEKRSEIMLFRAKPMTATAMPEVAMRPVTGLSSTKAMMREPVVTAISPLTRSVSSRGAGDPLRFRTMPVHTATCSRCITIQAPAISTRASETCRRTCAPRLPSAAPAQPARVGHRKTSRRATASARTGPFIRMRSMGISDLVQVWLSGLQPLRGILPSLRRGISSAKLQGRKRMSSCWRRMSSQPSLQAPVEPGRAKM